MLLYRTLGIMELDDCGMWIDRPIDEAEWLSEDQCPMPPAVPGDWLEDADLEPGEMPLPPNMEEVPPGQEAAVEAASPGAQRTRGVGARQFADLLGQAPAANRSGGPAYEGIPASATEPVRSTARRRVRSDEVQARRQSAAEPAGAVQ
jgi:hypothetical protein